GLVPGLRNVLVHQGRRLRPLPDVRPQHVLRPGGRRRGRRQKRASPRRPAFPFHLRRFALSSCLVVLLCRFALLFRCALFPAPWAPPRSAWYPPLPFTPRARPSGGRRRYEPT